MEQVALNRHDVDVKDNAGMYSTVCESGSTQLRIAIANFGFIEKVYGRIKIGNLQSATRNRFWGRDRAVRLTTMESCNPHGAPDLLSSAIENVVRNAIRYTAPQIAVEISVRCDEVKQKPHAELRLEFLLTTVRVPLSDAILHSLASSQIRRVKTQLFPPKI